MWGGCVHEGSRSRRQLCVCTWVTSAVLIAHPRARERQGCSHSGSVRRGVERLY